MRSNKIFLAVLILVLLGLFLAFDKKPSNSEDYEIAEILNDALQDEYHAEAVYEKVIAEFGEVRPYTNIVRAERTHSKAIESLYEKYNLQIPPNEWTDETNLPDFETIQEACQASAQAERDNIVLYDEILPNINEADIKTVFTNNRDASENNHLPAFVRCS